MGDFLAFRRMVTPVIIQIVFWLGITATIITGLTVIVTGADPRPGGGQQVLGGIAMLLLGPLVVRIYCELLILLFRINETLTDIKERLERGSDQRTTAP